MLVPLLGIPFSSGWLCSCIPADCKPGMEGGPGKLKKRPGESKWNIDLLGELMYKESRSSWLDKASPVGTYTQQAFIYSNSQQLSGALPLLAQPAFQDWGLPPRHFSFPRRYPRLAPLGIFDLGTPNSLFCYILLGGHTVQGWEPYGLKIMKTGAFRVCLYQPAIQHYLTVVQWKSPQPLK